MRSEKPGEQILEDTADQNERQIDIEAENQSQRRKLVVDLAWPSLAENFLMSLMSMVDMMMVGDLGSYAISAVGLVSQPRFIMLAAFQAMSTGTTALVARFRGARDREGANSAFQQSLIITVVLTAVLCSVMIFFAEPFIRWVAGTELSQEAISEGIKYFKIQIYGFPTLSLTFTINAALRGSGNTRTSFYNNTVANIVSMALNYTLIFGNLGFPRMEVAGASLATVIWQSVGLIMAVYVSAKGGQYIRLQFRGRWKPDFSMMKRVINIGLPALLEQAIMRVGMLWFTTIVTALGETSYAAHMVTMNIQQLSFTTGMAFGTASTTLVGQCLGRKRADLAKAYVSIAQKLGYFVSIAIAFLCFFGGGFLAEMYTNDMVIIGLASDMLKIIAISNPIANSRFVYVSALRGAGDARYMAVLSFIGVLLVRPAVSLLLTNVFHMGLTGIWIALVSDSIICFFMAMLRYRKGAWALIQV